MGGGRVECTGRMRGHSPFVWKRIPGLQGGNLAWDQRPQAGYRLCQESRIKGGGRGEGVGQLLACPICTQWRIPIALFPTETLCLPSLSLSLPHSPPAISHLIITWGLVIWDGVSTARSQALTGHDAQAGPDLTQPYFPSFFPFLPSPSPLRHPKKMSTAVLESVPPAFETVEKKSSVDDAESQDEKKDGASIVDDVVGAFEPEAEIYEVTSVSHPSSRFCVFVAEAALGAKRTNISPQGLPLPDISASMPVETSMLSFRAIIVSVPLFSLCFSVRVLT